MQSEVPVVRTGSRRTWLAFKIVSGVFAVGALGGLFGFQVITAWFDNQDGGIHRVHFMAFGVLFGVILTTAFVMQEWRAEQRISVFYQLLDVGLAAVLAGALSTTAGFAIFGGGLLVAYGILFALHPYRRELTRPRREGFSVPMLILTIGGAIPLIALALTTARFQRNGLPQDPHVNGDHWAAMCAMAIGIVLVAFLSCFKFRGWRITAWCASSALFLYGLISAAYPKHAGSEGRGWAAAAMAGAVVFAMTAVVESRRPRV